HRHEHRPHPRRGRQAVRRHPRADPPDRGQGATQAAPPVALRAAPQLPRHRLTDRNLNAVARSGRSSRGGDGATGIVAPDGAQARRDGDSMNTAKTPLALALVAGPAARSNPDHAAHSAPEAAASAAEARPAAGQAYAPRDTAPAPAP